MFTIFSICTSQFLCYFLIDDIFSYFASEIYPFIFLRILIAGLIYISINWITMSPIYKLEREIIFISYILFTISLTLFRIKLDYTRTMNFNIFDMLNYSKSTIFLNIVFFIPFGYYAKSRVKLKFIYSFAFFLTFIIFIELFQHYLNVGIFDISDLTLNSFGFIFGYLARKTVISFFTPKIKQCN